MGAATALFLAIFELCPYGCDRFEPDSNHQPASNFALSNIFYMMTRGEPPDAVHHEALNHYNLLLGKNGGCPTQTDLYFHEYGLSEETTTFWDATHRTQSFRLHSWILGVVASLGSVFTITVHVLGYVASAVVFVTLYYTDVAKDLFVAIQFRAKMLGGGGTGGDLLSVANFANNTYPMLLFTILAASVVLTEALNVAIVQFHLSSKSGLGWRILILPLTPILPGLTLIAESRQRLKLTLACLNSERSFAVVRRCRALESWLCSLRAEMRANEAVAEHFVQLSLLVVVLLAEASTTRTVQTAGNIVVESSRLNFAVFSIAVSLMSLMTAHVGFVAALKRNQLSLAGKVMTATYFLVSATGRLFAVVVFFTPVLGLFDILKMAQVGLLPASTYTVYDVTRNGGFRSLQDVWGQSLQLSSISDMFSGRMALVACLPLAILLPILHICTSLAIRMRHRSPIPRRWLTIHTFVCPPLFDDWEEYYRSASGSVSLRVSWIRSGTLFQDFVGLLAFENVCLCIPLVILRVDFAVRANALRQSFFPLLPQEEDSIVIANYLLAAAFAIFLAILPLGQFALRFLYLKYGHPWSRVIEK